MLIILEADSEQLALQLVVALVEQIFRGVVGGRLGLFALGMCDDGLGLVFCMLYHYYFIEEAKGEDGSDVNREQDGDAMVLSTFVI